MIVNILIFIAVLITIILIAALFISKKYSIEQDIIILSNKREIFNYVRLFTDKMLVRCLVRTLT